MKKLLPELSHSYHLFYLLMVFVAGISLIFRVFPRGSPFKYECQKGSPWRYQTLIAPFNFAILRTDAEIILESDSSLANYTSYLTLYSLVETSKTKEFAASL